MNRTCVQCSAAFQITPDDLAFYDKVSPVFGGKKYAVPPPTLCPDCRLQRRLSHNNESKLFRRTSSKSGKSIVSSIPPDSPHKVYEPAEWWADDWDARAFAKDTDPARPFFEQFHELLLDVPVVSLAVDSNENSEYVHYSGWDKNCYLCFCTDHSQDCMYCHSTYYATSAVDCYANLTIELCYECVHCKDCYRLSYARDCTNCSDSAFLYDCLNCKNCFGCVGLRQKQYCFFNEQLKKEEYEQKIAEYPLSKHATRALVESRMQPLLAAHPRRAYIGLNNESSTGDYLTGCKNASSCFDCDGLEDAKYCNYMRGGKDCQDVYRWGHPAELCYECMGVGEGVANLLFCMCCWGNCSALLYCAYCTSCRDCFGCVGLRHNSYCIFNKQYTKEEYEKLVPQLIELMQERKEWGEFHSANLSPYGYNHSIAQDFFPLTKQQALAKGFAWSDLESPPPEAKKTIAASQLPDDSADIPDDVLNWAIECGSTGKPFKINKQELEFYRRMKLPLPRLHPEERHKRRMALRNPRRLWERTCAKCSDPVVTSFAPDRPEIVVCEKCYLEAVY